MNFRIQNRVAMVAAASKGLGKAAALSLAKEGCKVSICSRSLESLQATQKELEDLGVDVLAVACDVSQCNDLEAWFRQTQERFGQVDILVTNTGGPKAATFQDLSETDWASGIESTLMNVVRLCRLTLPGMRARHWGRIVHITSLVAKQPTPILTISSTLRAGISGLTKTLAQETARDGVTVNALLPGHIMTDRQLHLGELKSKAEGISMDEYFQRTA
ncbi:MAG: SDR family NAD(P)-dependent oxidoreductase, partial [Holophaga sp.]|nr:SDR family NAD(P)-dependent oxidoreductase [Holophaga sp.]